MTIRFQNVLLILTVSVVGVGGIMLDCFIHGGILY